MRLVTKEMDNLGNMLIYLTTDDGVNIKCDVTTKDKMSDVIFNMIGDEIGVPLISYNYNEYLKQDNTDD